MINQNGLLTVNNNVGPLMNQTNTRNLQLNTIIENDYSQQKDIPMQYTHNYTTQKNFNQ